MRVSHHCAGTLVVLVAATSWAAATTPLSEVTEASLPAQTPAEKAIDIAHRGIESDGTTAEELLMLGVAFSRRARETAAPEWYDRSDEALDAALKLAPDAFAVIRQRVWNQLGRHEFKSALDGARQLNERAKDDVTTYGLMVDACVELGLYAEAEEAAQWMLDLRPGAPPAMTRVSYLREIFGDLSGAVEAMRMAFHSTRPSDAEDRAWILTHLAHLELERGRDREADAYVRHALELFPGYHYALKQLGELASFRGEYAEAVDAFERRYRIAPHPENLFDLARAMSNAGDTEGAQAHFLEFERLALEESEMRDNANLELIEYWVEVAPTPGRIARALELARARAGYRRDVLTLEALAWAQHGAGLTIEADATMTEALAIGSVGSRLQFRAGEIAAATGDSKRATAHFEQAWATAAKSQYGKRSGGYRARSPGDPPMVFPMPGTVQPDPDCPSCAALAKQVADLTEHVKQLQATVEKQGKDDGQVDEPDARVYECDIRTPH